MQTVLLIDDDVELVEMLKEYIEQENFSVQVAHDGIAGAQMLLEQPFDIVVLDVMMPRLNGIETLKAIRQHSNVPVIMLTAKGDNTDRIVGLELGADDYVPKPSSPRELVARIRAILRRVQPLETINANTQITVGALCIWPAQRLVEWDSQPVILTSTEYSLLEILAKNAGQIVSKQDLSQQALGRPLARFDRSIDVHLSSIRHKLGLLPDGRHCIQTVFRSGYQLLKS
ncbi:response regulator transcription factor [Methylotenera versatilis]|uniref:Two component transcriptional regulator, winged helix family n=1 Tax=Methylotenera versatilis (strain 301) TaxID=666681 RepID=D7DJ12_METV0|nr:response regulator transcription factor [Methylotenera versatilis]ADI30047.1 two component transcriptional regulator, winged helix family [Methylotenera versatilis 301]